MALTCQKKLVQACVAIGKRARAEILGDKASCHQCLEAFAKRSYRSLSEHDEVIQAQTRNCICSQVIHATTLPKTVQMLSVDN